MQMKENPNSLTWPDDHTWLTVLEPALRDDTGCAASACRLWFFLIEQVRQDPEGIDRAVSALNDALRLSFLHTAEFKASFEHYLVFCKGDLHPSNEPLSVIRAAIERGSRPAPTAESETIGKVSRPRHPRRGKSK